MRRHKADRSEFGGLSTVSSPPAEQNGAKPAQARRHRPPRKPSPSPHPLLNRPTAIVLFGMLAAIAAVQSIGADEYEPPAINHPQTIDELRDSDLQSDNVSCSVEPGGRYAVSVTNDHESMYSFTTTTYLFDDGGELIRSVDSEAAILRAGERFVDTRDATSAELASCESAIKRSSPAVLDTSALNDASRCVLSEDGDDFTDLSFEVTPSSFRQTSYVARVVVVTSDGTQIAQEFTAINGAWRDRTTPHSRRLDLRYEPSFSCEIIEIHSSET